MTVGKARRLKYERAAQRAGQPANEAAARLAMLETAVESVGDAFGEEADCAAAAALLRRVGEMLGFDLKPLPVSLLALNRENGDVAFMGPKASAKIPEDGKGRVEDHRHEGKDAGHIVLTLEDPPMLLDANLRQLGGYGMPALNLALRVDSLTPSSGEWGTRMGPLNLLYIRDEENLSLMERYESIYALAAENATALAGFIRSGMSAAQIRTRMINPR